jgi:hypothetical protein
MNRRIALAAAVGAAAAGAVTAAPALARHHATHLPPPRYRSLAVDEREWSVRPSHAGVGRGRVRITVYNRGMDDHDLAIAAPGGTVVAYVRVPAGASATIRPLLRRAGRYRLYCTFFAGTPEAHVAKGMHATILVR